MNKKQYERRMYFLLHSLNQTINQMVETNDDYYKDNELNENENRIKKTIFDSTKELKFISYLLSKYFKM
tara:strand:+ start:82 stop:288 length:207 start_codon:yes stop_codon:yes gene_type:complete